MTVSEKGGGGVWKWLVKRTVQVVVWVSMSAVVCVGIHLWMKVHNINAAESLLISMCDERARMLQDQFAVSVNHVHALAILVSTFYYNKIPPAINQSVFAHYTDMTSFERPLLSGVAYAQRVVRADREKFENQQGWIIKTMKKEPSPEQDEYAPVIFSQETISYIEALDMMSGEEDRENILRARSTGKAVLTNPFRLLESNHLGVILTFPVYRWRVSSDATVDERVKATVGYLGGAFDVESLVENLLKQLAGNKDIMVNVYDVTNISTPLIMYGSGPNDGYKLLSYASMLDFGDPFRRHQMECRYRQKPPITWPAITTPLGVFVICMLVGYILHAAHRRFINVVENCRKMEELKVKAEAADIAKSQFLATVSHEIRTPMNGVLGMLDMLLDTDLDCTQRDHTQTAQTCGKALISLINEVLDRAKIESGKLELEAVPFDLRAILDEVVSLFSSKSRDNGIELAVFVSSGVPDVLIGDPGRFRQILTNLVGNSVKFTERGHIFVHVRVAKNADIPMATTKCETCLNGTSNSSCCFETMRACSTLSGLTTADTRSTWEILQPLLSEEMPQPDSDDVSLMVTVEDTGVGIPLNAQNRMFTRFMQADSSTSRNYGGTGIGLSITKCLVEMMGGKIDFISHPDVGSTFTFTAMLKKCDTKMSSFQILPICFRGMNAVVIDEMPVRGAITKYHLQRLGIAAEIVSNIQCAAAAILGQNDFVSNGHLKKIDVILVESDKWKADIEKSLPKRLLDWKRSGKIPQMPKLVLMATSESISANTKGSVDIVVLKPLRASLLAACFEKALGVEGQKRIKTQNKRASIRNLLVGKSILVVDDNLVNRRVAEAALKKYGAQIKCVESGKDAILHLQIPHHFDACFMDVQMPEMDGFETTRQIRMMESDVNKCEKIERWHVLILAMTADVIQATYDKCINCGMDGYVSKPFEEEQLYDSLAKVFKFNDPSTAADEQ